MEEEICPNNGAGYSKEKEPQGPQGDKYAILPVVTAQGTDYVELICVEMPEVRFEDIIIFTVGGLGHATANSVKSIDPRFLQVCAQGTIKPVSVVPSMPVNVGSYVKDNLLVIDIESDKLINNQIEIVVKISGIRKGAEHKRFATHTYEEMMANNRF